MRPAIPEADGPEEDRKARAFLRMIYHGFLPRFWCELARRQWNGGFYERPVSDAAYSPAAARAYLARRAGRTDWQNEQLAVQHILTNFIGTGASVLDVPFGLGRFLDLYRERHLQVQGLDKSADMIAEAEKWLGPKLAGCRITLGDATAMPYEDRAFDLVVCFRFIPHIISFGQARKTLRELHRVSRRQVLVELGERPSGQYRRRRPTDLEKMESWLYPDEIAALLAESGLRIVYKTGPLKRATALTARYVQNIGNWHAFLCEKV